MVEGLISIDPPEDKPLEMWTPMANPDKEIRPPTPSEKAAYLKGLNDATMATNAAILLGKDVRYVRTNISRLAVEMASAKTS